LLYRILIDLKEAVAMKRKRVVALVLALGLTLLVTSVAGASGPPVKYDRWIECSDIGQFQYSYEVPGAPIGSWSAYGNTIDIYVRTYDWNLFSWRATSGIGAVIVKTESETLGQRSNVWLYDPQSTGDIGLYGPGQLDIHSATFCWTGAPVCADETAWAAGSRYVRRGNWATYTPYVAGQTVVLYAGQTQQAGTVTFSAPVDGMVTITIALNSGWSFADVAENVKIQDYATAPSGNPSPGLFTWKGTASGSSFSIAVPENNFYGVHVDVALCQ